MLWLLAGLGSIAIAGAAFWTIFSRYESLETGVLQKVSSDATLLYDYLDKMYLRQSMNRCYLAILIPTGVFGLIGLGVGFNFGILSGFLFAFILGAVGYRIPILIIKMMFSRRLVKFDKQLVDALDLMANAIKSGLSFMQVVQVIEREMPKPCSEEFGMVLKENRVGINLSDALMNMTKRVPSEDLFMIINSVVTLTQQGGDLSEAFDTIAKTIRERQRVLEKIRTLAQAGVTQGFILSMMPIAMLGMQFIIQPNYVRLLFVTPVGLIMMGFMVCLITAGALWMKKILAIEV
ncbi:MAG: type secretion system protein [Bacteriovoracaceae bacterium]|nr:type secretion system protein [Bacteriovoracaceae bacterium]